MKEPSDCQQPNNQQVNQTRLTAKPQSGKPSQRQNPPKHAQGRHKSTDQDSKCINGKKLKAAKIQQKRRIQQQGRVPATTKIQIIRKKRTQEQNYSRKRTTTKRK